MIIRGKLSMKKDPILKIFEKSGALLTGHFQLTSGLHSRQYFQCAKVLQYPEYAETLCSLIGRHFAGQNIAAVAAPAVGGIIVAHETARALKVRAVFTEREAGKMSLRRGFEILRGERVLVVEDVITTGGSVGEVIELVKACGAVPIGAACLVDRSGGKVDLGVSLFSLMKMNIQTMPLENCDLCRRGVPVVKPGSRKLANG